MTAAQGLNIRAAPTSQSALITNYPIGTVLNYIEVVIGENVAGNPYWGHSEQGHHYWMGGTDHPTGNLRAVTIRGLPQRHTPTLASHIPPGEEVKPPTSPGGSPSVAYLTAKEDRAYERVGSVVLPFRIRFVLFLSPKDYLTRIGCKNEYIAPLLWNE